MLEGFFKGRWVDAEVVRVCGKGIFDIRTGAVPACVACVGATTPDMAGLDFYITTGKET